MYTVGFSAQRQKYTVAIRLQMVYCETQYADFVRAFFVLETSSGFAVHA